MAFELRRGDEDSADPSQLGFDVLIDELADDKLYFKLRFENPTLVSQGLINDEVIGIILDETFFCSEDSSKRIERGTEIRNVLPKMLPGEEYEATLDTAQESIESTANTLVTGQIILTLVLSVSLK